jgi:hypothetical protein
VGRTERGGEEIQDRPFRFVTLRGDIRPRHGGNEMSERCTGALPFIMPH